MAGQSADVEQLQSVIDSIRKDDESGARQRARAPFLERSASRARHSSSSSRTRLRRVLHSIPDPRNFASTRFWFTEPITSASVPEAARRRGSGARARWPPRPSLVILAMESDPLCKLLHIRISDARARPHIIRLGGEDLPENLRDAYTRAVTCRSTSRRAASVCAASTTMMRRRRA